MTELLTAAQMRAIEQAAIESGEVTGLELMERAGRGVVEAIFEEWPELAKTSHKAVVLCGPGNNGGDGFVVARLLKEWGWEVEVFLYGDAKKLPPDARVNYELWMDLGEVRSYSREETNHGTSSANSDLLIDGLFGTGLKRAVTQPEELYWDVYQRWGRNQNELAVMKPKIVSIDIPSGVCSDSGRELSADSEDEAGIAVQANLSVSFHTAKLGHLLSEGTGWAGKTVVKSIGLEGSPRPRGGMKSPPGGAVGDCPAVPPGEIVRLVDRPSWLGKPGNDHKFSHGHALILSGPSGKGGAARLSARGALRIGAGLVTVAPTPGALQENAARLDAIMLSPVGDAQTLQAVLADERLNALCLGPGLGVDRARDLVPVALAAKRATVLDADALTSFKDDPSVLFDMLHDNCVLTPHAGEFARLFPDIAEKLNAPATKGPAYSKVDATREAAARAGCVVLFKGPDTVIAAPDGACSINSAAYERSAPWLATAGSGDVLAGFITGLLARGFAPMQAAETAAWLHVECALEFGPGLIAEDLPEQLPAVFRKLGT
ncbi:Bifunctional NAD(P)H-hydrate repair enzyme Nnr [Aliiroseovarius pelagivivens]|uniref:Bifunctional NAD(P)H-hydrate repair enzyme n=1 Tax=Aliiroseovarius pelagivivens TaxID=1639690 RepID=A0A2R8AKQ2_9RHOB|nr:NAD(P)H-hydrate dehydratase [Aliiroseovarius pelagivivens]SPF76613.1 Bifunctional NAD(P)H-hydrate repair enzyme Nnr [Aliiroseovarius pelagivivens]